jgi:predicted nucleic acid-binding protein
MTLDSIQSGTSLLLDANILVYASLGQSRQCSRLMERCAAGDVTPLLPAHIAAEFAHVMLVEEAKSRGAFGGANPVRSLSGRPEIVKDLSEYERMLRNLIAGGVSIEAVGKQDLLAMLALQRQFGLLVNDSLLLAVGQRLGVQNLASADKAFQKVRGWKVFCPDDL